MPLLLLLSLARAPFLFFFFLPSLLIFFLVSLSLSLAHLVDLCSKRQNHLLFFALPSLLYFHTHTLALTSTHSWHMILPSQSLSLSLTSCYSTCSLTLCATGRHVCPSSPSPQPLTRRRRRRRCRRLCAFLRPQLQRETTAAEKDELNLSPISKSQ